MAAKKTLRSNNPHVCTPRKTLITIIKQEAKAKRNENYPRFKILFRNPEQITNANNSSLILSVKNPQLCIQFHVILDRNLYTNVSHEYSTPQDGGSATKAERIMADRRPS